MKRFFIFGVLAAYVIGCATPALNQRADLLSLRERPDSAYIVLGQRISKASDVTTLIPMLYVNGRKMPVKGITVNSSAPNLMPLSVYGGATYAGADASGHAYRVWEIRPVPKGSKNIVFIHGVLSNSKSYTPIHSGAWNITPMPIAFKQDRNIFTAMTTKNFKDWYFYGCPFSIEGPGVYYLGEAEVVTGEVENTMDSPLVIQEVIGFSIKYYQDTTKLKSFLAGTQLEGMPLIDSYENWEKNTGDALREYINRL